MREDVLAELKRAGIDPETLTDKEFVEKAARWALQRGRSLNKVFDVITSISPRAGRPSIPAGEAFRREFRRDSANYDWPIGRISIMNCWAAGCSTTRRTARVRPTQSTRRPCCGRRASGADDCRHSGRRSDGSQADSPDRGPYHASGGARDAAILPQREGRIHRPHHERGPYRGPMRRLDYSTLGRTYTGRGSWAW